jgi:SAM-dependent methyltransferase
MTERVTARDERAHWEARYAEVAGERDAAPSPWIVDRALRLPADTLFVDVAGGSGRHAEALATAERSVVLLDFVARAVRTATARHRGILGLVADVAALPIRPGAAGAIVCVNFLDRTIFPALAAMLARGGVLLYETFTIAHLDLIARGRARGPRNPDYLLRPNEVLGLVAPLVVQEHDEATVVDAVGERSIARVMAVKR